MEDKTKEHIHNLIEEAESLLDYLQATSTTNEFCSEYWSYLHGIMKHIRHLLILTDTEEEFLWGPWEWIREEEPIEEPSPFTKSPSSPTMNRPFS